MANIDRKLFYRYLDDLFKLPLSKSEQKNLNPVISYWNKYYEDDKDERLLAYVLATVHHRTGASKSPDADEGDVRETTSLGVSRKQLRIDFQAQEELWKKVAQITADTESSRDMSAHMRLSNMFYTALGKLRPLTLVQVLSEELKYVRGGDTCAEEPRPVEDEPNDSDENLEDIFKRFHACDLKALCISGGGIRSATFGLGIMQALAQHKLLTKFDYLSTVSGGGYLGSWLSAWTRRERVKRAKGFNALSPSSAAEVRLSSDIGVTGLSDIQIVVLRILVEFAEVDTIAELRVAASKVLLDSEAFTARQIKILKELASGSGEIEGLPPDQFEKLADLSAKEKDFLLNDPEFHDAGIHSIQDQINCVNITSEMRPTPEPIQLRHLREYSNYMSPKTGLLSADTWALVAIYLRNLLLNLTIFLPLIAAVLILPRVLFLTVNRMPTDILREDAFQFRILTIAVVLGGLAFAFVIRCLPSKNQAKSTAKPLSRRVMKRLRRWLGREDEDADPVRKTIEQRMKAFIESEAGVLLLGVLPIMTSAFLAACLWAWNYRLGGNLYTNHSVDLPIVGEPKELGFFLAAAAAAFVVGLLTYGVINRFRNIDGWEIVGALLSSFVGAVILWLAALKFFDARAWSKALGGTFASYEWQVYLTLSVPAFLVIVLIAATMFVGLSSRKATDEDREWLARFGGWILVLSGGWIALNVLVLIGPSVLQWLFRGLFDLQNRKIDWDMVFSWKGLPAILSTVAGLASGVVSLGGGFSGKSLVRDEPVKSRTSKLLSFLPQIAAVLFLVFILVGIALLTTFLIAGTGSQSAPQFNHVTVLQSAKLSHLLTIFLCLTSVGLFMACFVNVNKFSLHGAYRDRLTRAYLGASNESRDQNTFTGFDDADNLELHNLENQRPFHVINATVNLVGGKNLAWQNRKAATFTMTPLHCGSWAVRGYRRSKDYCVSFTSGKALRLGTAMAISGAAANPNMGYFSSPVVTFLMSLFNIRLGWWLGNTGPAGSDFHWFGFGRRRFFEKVGPSIAVFPLINETLGRTDEEKHFLNVTDGGHFENLALYEMILRRCRFIVLSDGAADDGFKFGEISNAIQKCKVDLGVDIKFNKGIKIVSRDTDADGKKGSVRFAVADITYPEMVDGKQLTGSLLYMRPTYYENEYTDIKYYAEANDTFPHQSTGDQMYDEKQFEAYRGLGYFTMMEVYKTFFATSKGDPAKEVDDDLENFFATENEMRKTVFDFFGFDDFASFRPRRPEVDSTDLLKQSARSLARTFRRSAR